LHGGQEIIEAVLQALDGPGAGATRVVGGPD
jgi:hypothetical protein